ncbi:MAG: class I SAM-dependent methyltransferase [Acidobacteriota bacterium]|nr:class I SAM-dependent methyltransferase [Acidobacteriota bacterium]
MNTKLDPTSLERIVPSEIRTEGTTASDTLELHLQRYHFARRHLVPGTVLDMACGVGYGTEIMASGNPAITHATGVDICEAAVEHARATYQSPNVQFQCSDAMAFSPGYCFNNVVSLETVEHVDDPKRLFELLVQLLTPGGRLISSVPVTPSVDANPHHQTNFTVASFEAMASVHSLKLVDRMDQVQPFNPLALARKAEPRAASMRPNMTGFYLRHPSHFFLRVWSTITDGFANKYVTLVWEKPGGTGKSQHNGASGSAR